MKKNIKIFVYGSLRTGFFNYDKYLKGKVTSVKQAKILNMDLYHMPYKGYPAICHGNGEILGEVMVIDDYENTMKELDEMEGFINENNPENEYHKVLLPVVFLENGHKEECYTYFYNRQVDKKFDIEAIFIENGDWKNYMLKNID